MEPTDGEGHVRAGQEGGEVEKNIPPALIHILRKISPSWSFLSARSPNRSSGCFRRSTTSLCTSGAAEGIGSTRRTAATGRSTRPRTYSEPSSKPSDAAWARTSSAGARSQGSSSPGWIRAAGRPLKLVDLTGPGQSRAGVDARLFAGSYSVSQGYSLAIHDHPAPPDGIRRPARHDTGQVSVALFERARASVSAEVLGALNEPQDVDDLSRILGHYVQFGYRE